MNRREKELIRAYIRALKYASHTESKARIVLTGARGTGIHVCGVVCVCVCVGCVCVCGVCVWGVV